MHFDKSPKIILKTISALIVLSYNYRWAWWALIQSKLTVTLWKSNLRSFVLLTDGESRPVDENKAL